ncbi:hypothetical protein LCGC14_1773270, partial [marine sediment metagenome]
YKISLDAIKRYQAAEAIIAELREQLEEGHQAMREASKVMNAAAGQRAELREKVAEQQRRSDRVVRLHREDKRRADRAEARNIEAERLLRIYWRSFPCEAAENGTAEFLAPADDQPAEALPLTCVYKDAGGTVIAKLYGTPTAASLHDCIEREGHTEFRADQRPHRGRSKP